MKKSVTQTHYYRDRKGIVRPYYTAIIEPLPCTFCSGQNKMLKRAPPEEKND